MPEELSKIQKGKKAIGDGLGFRRESIVLRERAQGGQDYCVENSDHVAMWVQSSTYRFETIKKISYF